MKLSDYEQQLLDAWEEVSKRGQLTTWIMLALKDGPKHTALIKEFIAAQTKDVMATDDQSLYRALRRYLEAELVAVTTQPGDGGAERKVYHLTGAGQHVLDAFLDRNVKELFYQPEIRQLIERDYS